MERRGSRMESEGRGKVKGVRRVPLTVWVIGGVVAVHVLFFWWAADKHFLPKARYVPPPLVPNFAARRSVTVDPQTGEATTREDFVVSTRLATPRPSRSPQR